MDSGLDTEVSYCNVERFLWCIWCQRLTATLEADYGKLPELAVWWRSFVYCVALKRGSTFCHACIATPPPVMQRRKERCACPSKQGGKRESNDSMMRCRGAALPVFAMADTTFSAMAGR